MIREGLMQNGSFTLDLVDDAPLEVRRLAAQLGTLISITPTRVTDADATVATVMGAAAFTGVMTRKSNKLRTLAGFGLGWYLQSGKGFAGTFGGTSVPALPTTFAALLDAWLSAAGTNSNQIDRGTAYSASTTAITDITIEPSGELPPIKPHIDVYAKQTGNEYRITPAGLVDYGVSTSLFRSTPSVMIVPGMSGREYGYRLLDVDERSWDLSTNVDNYRDKAYYETSDALYKASGGATSTDQVLMYRLGGSAGYVSLGRPYQQLRSTSSGDVTNALTAAANLHCDADYEIRCTVREFCPPTFLIPGDWVYVYSPDDDFYDTANQITAGGALLFPKKIRVTGYTWPVEAGMGVYGLYNDVVTDLTDYVKWETGRGTSLEFDTRPPTLQAAADSSIIS